MSDLSKYAAIIKVVSHRATSNYADLTATPPPDYAINDLLDLLDVISAYQAENAKLRELIQLPLDMLGTTWTENHDSYDRWRKQVRALIGGEPRHGTPEAVEQTLKQVAHERTANDER